MKNNIHQSLNKSIVQDQQLFVKMALLAWNSYLRKMDTLLAELSDEQLFMEVSPGKNRGIYLLGHLVAIHDGMIPILGLGQRMYPELDAAFVANPDRSNLPFPAVAELRRNWTNINATLNKYFGEMSAGNWFQRHNLMTDEDLLKEPHRNKLSVLMNRTNHMAWHYGQMLLLK